VSAPTLGLYPTQKELIKIARCMVWHCIFVNHTWSKRGGRLDLLNSCGEIDILLNSIDLEILVICQEFYLPWGESNALSGMGSQKNSI
jgi:hypothetical protein